MDTESESEQTFSSLGNSKAEYEETLDKAAGFLTGGGKRC
jgi:hypothetical protein